MMMQGEGTTDYDIYLKTQQLFSCQSNFGEFCNGDELQFQIVHQINPVLLNLKSNPS